MKKTRSWHQFGVRVRVWNRVSECFYVQVFVAGKNVRDGKRPALCHRVALLVVGRYTREETSEPGLDDFRWDVTHMATSRASLSPNSTCSEAVITRNLFWSVSPVLSAPFPFFYSSLPFPLSFPRLEVAPQIQLRNVRERCLFPRGERHLDQSDAFPGL